MSIEYLSVDALLECTCICIWNKSHFIGIFKNFDRWIKAKLLNVMNFRKCSYIKLNVFLNDSDFSSSTEVCLNFLKSFITTNTIFKATNPGKIVKTNLTVINNRNTFPNSHCILDSNGQPCDYVYTGSTLVAVCIFTSIWHWGNKPNANDG